MKEYFQILCTEFISFVTRDSYLQEMNSNDVTQNREFGKCDYLNGVHIFTYANVGAGVAIKILKQMHVVRSLFNFKLRCQKYQIDSR
jgi:hypothetical protein